jgi:hypothetical protein
MIVGYSNGQLCVISKDGSSLIVLKNCVGSISDLFRVSCRCIAVVAQEAADRVRLFVVHRLDENL